MVEEWITTREAAQLSGYHPEHVRRLIRDKDILARKFGPIWQVSKQSLLEYLAKAEQSDDKRWGPKSQT